MRTDPKLAYMEYLRSDRWRQLRAEALQRDGYACRVCASTVELNVHHREYRKRWGGETVDDLTTLCRRCHERHHTWQKWDQRSKSLPTRAIAVSKRGGAASLVNAERCRVLTAILLRHPMLLPDVKDAYVGLDLPSHLAMLRTAALMWGESTKVFDPMALMTHLANSGLQAEAEQALAMGPVPLPACASSAAMPVEASVGWWQIFAKSIRPPRS
jgi:HNH endonuclease